MSRSIEQVEHYIPLSGYHEERPEIVLEKLDRLLEQFPLDGIEVYLASIVSRDQPLFTSQQEKDDLVERLRRWQTKRVHCSYWAEPTDFLDRGDYSGLLERFGGEDEVVEYFGDLTGEKIFARWAQEYEIAKEIGAQAVTFHLIDYFHIDGLWQFSMSRQQVVEAMTGMTQGLLDELGKRNLLKDGPLIELENAGFGLEYGVQRVDDYLYIFNHVEDPHDRLRVAWDINHLLHGIGFDEGQGRARFFLTEEEITSEMRSLEEKYGDNANLFAEKWVAHNLLDPRLVGRISAIHLSDNTLKRVQYFENGQLTGEYLEEIQALPTDEEKEEYGVGIVLKHYDSHEPLGVTLKNFPPILRGLQEQTPSLSILHELKNNELDEDALRKQFEALGI